ncbi:class I fructose-bisphosphate aldolase [Salinisphaera sp. USBA-960]|uniref:class I fructose-bisphosphate aldolase n=1 Tax=Salinisphaera orenii TaxID=856731 RepID=UPI000DBE8C88|nr:class I fructose-bisphosphate aldolase [Salifodinibacter halophilus]NNC26147.1 class I fructose-bisphosphate aldolase [Salifodinibacter halophilus]
MIDIESHLGNEADDLLGHKCETIDKSNLYLPGPDFVDRVVADSDRSPAVMASLQRLFDHGRLGGTGYLGLLPVDQGIEHSGGASFGPNPIYFDPKNIVELAMEGGCNGVASTLGVLSSVARRYAHRIPFILKLNHNETLSLPPVSDQTLFADVEQAKNMGCAAVGATIYYGSPECRRQIQEISEAFERAHELGMATVLWAYLRNDAFKKDGVDHHTSADLTGQAIHMAATINADIVKQKMATNNRGYTEIGFGNTHERVYDTLSSDHPIDLARYQVANCYMGRTGLINSGGSSGSDDYAQAVRTAVINKRAGGTGLISGRKAFQKSMKDGVALLNAIQDVYLDDNVTIA